MPIISALYRDKGIEKELLPNQIELESYEKFYKGNLYCTTNQCNARLVYVYKVGTTGFLRTWQFDNHIDDCIYKFERIAGRKGINVEYTLNVELSEERKNRSLKEAFKQALLTEEEREQIRIKRKNKRKNPTTDKTELGPKITLVRNDGISEDEAKTEGVRGRNLLKREAHALKESDVGQLRTLFGNIKGLEYSSSGAMITIENKNKFVYVKFEEAFIANSPNDLGLFHFIERYCKEIKHKALFVGIGQVQESKDGKAYDFIVFHGNEFTVHGMSLRTLAAKYAREDLN
nr:hypothetical protein [Brevibacillus laterosporus]